MTQESRDIMVFMGIEDYVFQEASAGSSWKVQGDTKKRELLRNPTKIEETPPPQNIYIYIYIYILTEIEPL